jgi:predicted chitinase
MADAIEKTPIPPNPPTSAGATQGAVAGIAAIIAACEEGGFKSKYAKCAMLGIAGVESKWMHTADENHKYSAKRIRTVWPKITQAEAELWNNSPEVKYSKQEFFGFIYGTKITGNPANGQYYGRGYIQLTLRCNYKEIGSRLGIDLINHPELLQQSAEIGAKAVVEYFKMNISDWDKLQWEPSFFEVALSKVGGHKGGWPAKRKYYEYFLGGKSAPAPTNKDAVSSAPTRTQVEINALPASRREAYTEDRSGNFSKTGFCDPEGKYPLRDFMNEPDTNRLARGNIEDTHVKFKDATRAKNIPLANGGSYDQPESAYNTIYPYNKVMESESGHVLEFDDSPEGERINLYHRKGTFIEIDPNGSQVNYIVGDGYYITENNGNIFIKGTCNLTVSGPMNILCQGDANLEVCGQVDAVFHNNVNIGVAQDLNVAVGGDYNVLVEGNYNVEVGKTSNHRAIGTMSLESTDALKLKTAKSISLEGGDTASTAETLLKMSSSIKFETEKSFEIKADSMKFDIANAIQMKSASYQLQTSGNISLGSGDTIGLIAPKIENNNPSTTFPSITSLTKLGTSQVPVDFAGNQISGRSSENTLVNTYLTPMGTYNPNTLPKTVVDSVLNKIPLSSGLLGLFGGSQPDIYDPKYSEPMERKTSLSTAGVSENHVLVVPPTDSAHQQGGPNLMPPARHTDGVFKFETEDDWNTASGQKARVGMVGTSDYENNGNEAGTSGDSSPATGGTGAGTQLSSEKLTEINNMTDFPTSYKLSDNFTLGMLTSAQGKVLKNTTLPDGVYSKQQLVANLSALCINILEKVYAEIGPSRQQDPNGIWNINSGLRNETGGSFHNKGEACDIQLSSRDITEHYELAVKLEKILPYNQVILEYRNKGNSVWIHLSYSMKGSMKLCTTYIDDKNVNSSGKPASGSNGLLTFYV